MNCTLRVVSNFLGAVQKNRDSPNHINILFMKKFTFQIYRLLKEDRNIYY